MSQAASQRRVGTNLTTGPIMKSLLLFAFPIVCLLYTSDAADEL